MTMTEITESAAQTMEDSIRRDDLRVAFPAPKAKRLRLLWQVTFGGARNPSARLYNAAKAKRIAARFNRLFRIDIAYADRFGKVRL